MKNHSRFAFLCLLATTLHYPEAKAQGGPTPTHGMPPISRWNDKITVTKGADGLTITLPSWVARDNTITKLYDQGNPFPITRGPATSPAQATIKMTGTAAEKFEQTTKDLTRSTINLTNKRFSANLPAELPAQQFNLEAGKPLDIRAIDAIAKLLTDTPPPNQASLLINHVDVVEDKVHTFDPFYTSNGSIEPHGNPAGLWSFGSLVRAVIQAGNPSPSLDDASVAAWLNDWFKQWETEQEVMDRRNTSVGTIFAEKVIKPWRERSGNGLLAPALAPFRLLAITNRIDLRQSYAYGGAIGETPSNAGQIHFVFGAVLPTGEPIDASLIFEFGVEKNSLQELIAYGKRWAALSQLWPDPDVAPSRDFVKALTSLLHDEIFLNPHLRSIRTNSGLQRSGEWLMRQFQLQNGQLISAPVSQTPHWGRQDTAVLNDYFCSHKETILDGRYLLPRQALSAEVSLSGTVSWGRGYNITRPENREARYIFALNTCNGCHSVETEVLNVPDDSQTMLQNHIARRNAGFASHLSKYLTKGPLTDTAPEPPVTKSSQSELERRAFHLYTLISGSEKEVLIRDLFFTPIAGSQL